MDEKEKARIRAIPRRKCSICGQKRNYTDPMAKCFECKKDFCFDHIHCLQYLDKMPKEEEYRDVCENCKKKHGYKTA